MPRPYFWWSLPWLSAKRSTICLVSEPRAPSAEDRVLGAQLHAAGEVGVGLAVAADAHVAGGDADHLAVARPAPRPPGSPDRSRRRAPRPCGRDSGQTLPSEPTKLPWLSISLGMNRLGILTPPACPRIQELVGGDLGLERPVGIGAPFGQQAVEADRVDHRAGEDVGADLRAFLDHDDGDSPSRLGGAFCLRRMAVARPAGPAPTTTTSKSIASRAGRSDICSMTNQCVGSTSM